MPTPASPAGTWCKAGTLKILSIHQGPKEAEPHGSASFWPSRQPVSCFGAEKSGFCRLYGEFALIFLELFMGL